MMKKTLLSLVIIVAIILNSFMVTSENSTLDNILNDFFEDSEKKLPDNSNIDPIYKNNQINYVYEKEDYLKIDFENPLPSIFNDNIVPPSFLDNNTASGEIIIKLKENSHRSLLNDNIENTKFGISTIDVINEKNNVISIEKRPSGSSFFSNLYKVKVEEDSNILSLVQEYKNDPNVEYAEPNYIFKTLNKPNDPFYNQQWALNKINAENGWNIETGNSDIIISIIDTGVDYNHEDLADNIWYDSDNNPGWNFVDNNNDPMDYRGHGTHCAGIAGAVTNNNVGIAGVSWNCKIMPLKGLDDYGYGYLDDLAESIIYAADNGADVISMSWGGSFYSQLLHDAIEYAYSKDVVLVAAAGNSNSKMKLYPAAYENVISVSATDQNDERASFSSYGYHVDVAAPGVRILSTLPDDDYGVYSGTSMACPHVAGLAGLILSKNTFQYRKETVKTIIKNSVEPVVSNHYIGTGRINLYEALSKEPAVAVLYAYPEELDFQGVVDISGIVWSEKLQNYVIEYGQGKNPDSWFEIKNSTENTEGVLATFNTTGIEDGIYTIKLTVVCDNATFFDTMRIVVNNEISFFTVNDDGTADFTSIQDAMDNSGKGDTVFVYNGIYKEDIEIIRSVNLIGQNNKYTKIYGSIIIYADYLNVSGFTTDAAFSPLDPLEPCGIIVLSCKNVNISNNYFYKGDYGIEIYYSNNLVVYNNTFENNKFMAFYLFSSENNSISQNSFKKTDYGLFLGLSYNNTISDNFFENIFYDPILILISGGNILRNNQMTKQGLYIYGIELIDFKNDVDTSNTVNGKPIYYLVDKKGFTIPSDASQIILVNCSDGVIENFIFDGYRIGMNVCFSTNISIINNNFTNCHLALIVQKNDDDIIIFSNNFKNNTYSLASISNNIVTIKNNSFLGNIFGNWIQASKNSNIINNFYKDNNYGVLSILGNNSLFLSNSFKSNQEFGILFMSSSDNILKENKFINCGIMINGGKPIDFWNEIDTTNTVNDRPIYYYINQTDVLFTSDAGQIILVNCSGFEISNLEIVGNIYSLKLAFSDNNNISNCKLDGIYLTQSNENIISDNYINKSNFGIELVDSHNNIIRNNSICNGNSKHRNYRGIDLYKCNNNTIIDNFLYNITGYKEVRKGEGWKSVSLYEAYNIILRKETKNNIIKDNKIICGQLNHSEVYGNGNYGIYLFDDSEENNIISNIIKNNMYGIFSTGNNNIFYHNVFLNNLEYNAYDMGNNIWYNSILKQGNYWDDYDGVDFDGDGIGDIPYNIPGGDNKDLYPLTKHSYVPNIKITKPINALYIFNLRIRRYLFRIPRIIGRINIEVEASDENFEINRVEFYINDELKSVDTEAPYTYTWEQGKLSFFNNRHTIKAVAYNNNGIYNSDEITVRKFL